MFNVYTLLYLQHARLIGCSMSSLSNTPSLKRRKDTFNFPLLEFLIRIEHIEVLHRSGSDLFLFDVESCGCTGKE